MYPGIRDELIAQRIADLHRQAATQRLLRQLHADRPPAARCRRARIWRRLLPRRPRPALSPASGGR